MCRHYGNMQTQTQLYLSDKDTLKGHAFTNLKNKGVKIVTWATHRYQKKNMGHPSNKQEAGFTNDMTPLFPQRITKTQNHTANGH